MNLKLSEHTLRQACRELFAQSPWMSGRQVRAALRTRFGSSGRAERVYAIWRSIRDERTAQSLQPREQVEIERELAEVRQQLSTLQTALFDAEQRAFKSEERERLHQDRWASEIYELRQEVLQLRSGRR